MRQIATKFVIKKLLDYEIFFSSRVTVKKKSSSGRSTSLRIQSITFLSSYVCIYLVYHYYLLLFGYASVSFLITDPILEK